MTWDRTNLPWLPEPRSNFAAHCRDLVPGGARGNDLRALASRRLNANQLTSLRRAIDRIAADPQAMSPLVPLRVALIGDGSQELVADGIAGTAPRHGLHVSIVDVPFNTGTMMALDASSELHRARPDVVLINFTYRAFGSAAAFDDRDTADTAVDAAVRRIRGIVDSVSTSWRPVVMLQTIPPPSEALFGSLDRLLPGTMASMCDAINRGVLELARSPHVLLDAAALAHTVGLDAWHDHTQWHSYKLPFAQRLVPLYADFVVRSLAALRGLSRKCLVLDLDNTLWGGVIGDDGLEGIRLGQGLADGEAFLEVQRTARQLRQRGVVLAVSSKNTDAVARQAFREHPDMILEESDIALFQANWDDKPRNLAAIAKALDIGLDSLVLLDDNPAERELVRQQLPQVAVVELPEDPALYPRALLASGLFEAVSYSAEDGRRTEMYSARAMAAAQREGVADLAAFLDSLEMEITFAPFDAVSRSRVAQLINKSNQFNLTTRRYTEAEVQAMEGDPGLFTLQVRLKDKFADHGIISVIICRTAGARSWDIDTWLMSCRVLGRRVQEAVLAELVEQAAARGITELKGEYIATGRNAIVADHYGTLGFSCTSKSAEHSAWSLAVAGHAAQTRPFAVRRPVGK